MKNLRQTIIFLVRHGEIKNPKRILYGRTFDVELDQTRLSKTINVAKLLANNSITTIYSGPSLRTRQTAEILLPCLGLGGFLVANELDEVLTKFDGTPLEQIETIDANVFGTPGETIEDIRRRMSKFILLCLRKHQGKNICLVTHGDPMLICYQHFVGKKTIGLKDIRSKFGAKYPPCGSAIKMVLDGNKLINSDYLNYEATT